MRTATAFAGMMATGVAVAVVFTVNPAVCAAAKTDVVYIGGTGTGMVPHNPNVGIGLTAPLGLDVDEAVSVLYDGAPWAHPANGADPARAAMEAVQGDPITVIGISKGAQATHYVAATDTRQDTHYVRIGDPDGDGGISRHFGFSPPKAENTHDTTEIFAEYDGVADWPDRFTGGLAEANALMGWVLDHTQYANGTARDPLTRLDEAEVTVTTNPNGTSTTRMMIPTHALPLTRPLRDVEHGLTGRTVVTDRIDGALRPIIDSGYSRNDKPKAEKPSKAEKTAKTAKAERAEKRKVRDRDA